MFAPYEASCANWKLPSRLEKFIPGDTEDHICPITVQVAYKIIIGKSLMAVYTDHSIANAEKTPRAYHKRIFEPLTSASQLDTPPNKQKGELEKSILMSHKYNENLKLNR
jgi:hypothetical protein